MIKLGPVGGRETRKMALGTSTMCLIVRIHIRGIRKRSAEERGLPKRPAEEACSKRLVVVACRKKPVFAHGFEGLHKGSEAVAS